MSFHVDELCVKLDSEKDMQAKYVRSNSYNH